MSEFDEDAFAARVDFVSVPDNGILVFHFKDGREKTVTWKSTAKRDCWTPERKAVWSEYNCSGGREGTGMGFNEYIAWKEANGKCQKQ